MGAVGQLLEAISAYVTGVHVPRERVTRALWAPSQYGAVEGRRRSDAPGIEATSGGTRRIRFSSTAYRREKHHGGNSNDEDYSGDRLPARPQLTETPTATPIHAPRYRCRSVRRRCRRAVALPTHG